jgi:hypothetical protein
MMPMALKTATDFRMDPLTHGDAMAMSHYRGL